MPIGIAHDMNNMYIGQLCGHLSVIAQLLLIRGLQDHGYKTKSSRGQTAEQDLKWASRTSLHTHLSST